MTTLKTSFDTTLPDHGWVVDVLRDEELDLSNARRVKHYGRAKLSRNTRLVLWLLRFYVIIMMLIIVIQVWLGVHQ